MAVEGGAGDPERLRAWALSRNEPGLLARIDPPPVSELAAE
jgi:hypothetical protein